MEKNKNNKLACTPNTKFIHLAAGKGTLHRFVKKDDNTIRKLLKKDKDGWSGLHYAGLAGNLSKLKFFGVLTPENLLQQNSDGKTPLELQGNNRIGALTDWGDEWLNKDPFIWIEYLEGLKGAAKKTSSLELKTLLREARVAKREVIEQARSLNLSRNKKKERSVKLQNLTEEIKDVKKLAELAREKRKIRQPLRIEEIKI